MLGIIIEAQEFAQFYDAICRFGSPQQFISQIRSGAMGGINIASKELWLAWCSDEAFPFPSTPFQLVIVIVQNNIRLRYVSSLEYIPEIGVEKEVIRFPLEVLSEAIKNTGTCEFRWDKKPRGET